MTTMSPCAGTPGGQTVGAMTWPAATAAAAAGRLLAVPLGSTEQHGPHLPLATDTLVATALAHGLAARRPDVVVAPALPYGSSGEHAGFSGTLSIGQAALEAVVVELVRSADAWEGVVLVNGHGGNAEPLARAARTLSGEGRSLLPWSPRPTRASLDLHAGRTETSLLLCLAPQLVGADRPAGAVDLEPAAALAAMRRGGVRAVADNGVVGDPAGASAEEGREMLEAMVADLDGAVTEWLTAAGGARAPALRRRPGLGAPAEK